MDIKLIKNIESLGEVLPRFEKLEIIKCIEKSNDKSCITIVSQELLNEFPDLVYKNQHGYLFINTEKLTFILFKAVQELQTELQVLKEKKTRKRTK